MFKTQSLFAIVEEDTNQLAVYKIETTEETQKEVCSLLSNGIKRLVSDKECINFDGCYKPDINEICVIKEFKIDQKIIEAIKNPLGVNGFSVDKNSSPKIKALCMGKYDIHTKQFTIAFQRFRKDQYISRMGINLFYDRNTFIHEKGYGICITDIVDCAVENNELRFGSFYYARQIFDLSNYYREATDKDIEKFIGDDKISVNDGISFKDMADSFIRRKIALICDSGIFSKYSVRQIGDRARKFGIEIHTSKNKICLPEDKNELKFVLKFLDDEIYKGIFSEDILQTNSKRKVNI